MWWIASMLSTQYMIFPQSSKSVFLLVYDKWGGSPCHLFPHPTQYKRILHKNHKSTLISNVVPKLLHANTITHILFCPLLSSRGKLKHPSKCSRMHHFEAGVKNTPPLRTSFNPGETLQIIPPRIQIIFLVF